MPFQRAHDKDIATQQSIYSGTNKDYVRLRSSEVNETQTNRKAQQQREKDQVPIHGKIGPVRPAEKRLTVVREDGGQVWDDPTLLEWDPAHFRLFVGDLAGEVTDVTLHKAFAKYPTLVKARVVRDRRTDKSKGYGFVSFTSPDDFLRSWKEMNGKYVGSHPIKLRKATTELKPKVISEKSLEAKKRFSPYERAKTVGSANNWKDIKKKERRHNKLIGLQTGK
jgi:hypothetical protein